VDLLQNIRTARVRQRRKQPHKRGVFHIVSGIVKGYGLDENFLKRLDEPDDCLARKGVELTEARAKEGLELPPFILVSKAEYRLAMTITEKWDNAYLQFARSPEEILLSAALYAVNPSLWSRDLLRYEFETLLLCERAKKELSDLEERSGSLNGTADQGLKDWDCRGEGSQSNEWQERISQLRAYVAKVENMEFLTR
jgi:hypothetical protein